MAKLIPINPLETWLTKTLIETNFIYIDRWSMVHLFSGLVLGYLITVYIRDKFAWILLFFLLIGYEIFEKLTEGILFEPENYLDILWDLIIGTIGFFIMRQYLQFKKRK